ncbi:DUF616 domain-containing protein [Chlorobium phaeovibrioides]|nr:DUF616 domain-containing protein [Chlorobium phaeovibrioides]
MSKRLVVYTVLMGYDYGLLPIHTQEGVDFICFTDQQNIEPNGWAIQYVEPFITMDSVRSSREIKIRPHRWLTEYSSSIYIDSTVHLRKDPLALWDYLMPNETTVFGAFFHSRRVTLADEFSIVAKKNLDYQHTINEQFNAYRLRCAQILHEKPVWGGVLARRHNSPSCVKAMEIWFAHVLRFSRRDQLSLPLALSHLPSKERNFIMADNLMSDFHKWPIASRPKPPNYTVREKKWQRLFKRLLKAP